MSQVFLAVGDLAMDRDNYDDSFAATREVLAAADIAFGQIETSFASSIGMKYESANSVAVLETMPATPEATKLA